jgi:hypothetical protein
MAASWAGVMTSGCNGRTAVAVVVRVVVLVIGAFGGLPTRPGHGPPRTARPLERR